jgi:peroxiredoxin Q/BCP
LDGIEMVKINKTRPEFCLNNQDNEPVCITDYLGKWVVLYFYPKDDTTGCTLEAKNFSLYKNDFDKLNTKVIGISPDSCESHQKFQKKHNLTVTLLSDPEHQALEQYGVWKTKKMYGKEYMGVERTTYLINPQGSINHIWNKVKVTGHIEAVIEKLIELQNNQGGLS